MARGNDLAAILVDERIVGKRELERVDRARRGRPLWAALLDAELTSEDELFFVLASRLPGAAVATDDLLAQVDVPAPLRARFSQKDALAAGLLPVELAGDRVTVVMVDPTDVAARSAFLTRVGLKQARALLGRRRLIEQAVARSYSPHRVDEPKSQPTIVLDPSLAAEIKRLGPRVLGAEPLTPMPRLRRRRSTQASPPPTPAPKAPPAAAPDALEREERLTAVLFAAVDVLARELERRLQPDGAAGDLSTAVPRAGELARLGRRVARQLGLDRRAVDQIGVAAQLSAVDRLLRRSDDATANTLTAEAAGAAADADGLAPILRALSAAGPSAAGKPPLAARVISVITDYLELAGSGEADLGTVSQLLRASAAGAPVVDALLRVLEGEAADATPPDAVNADDKTIRRAFPKRPKESNPR